MLYLQHSRVLTGGLLHKKLDGVLPAAQQLEQVMPGNPQAVPRHASIWSHYRFKSLQLMLRSSSVHPVPYILAR